MKPLGELMPSRRELLKFGVKAKGGKFALDYKFGPGNLGGGFLITSVVGKDDATASKAADSWKVAFVVVYVPLAVTSN